MYVNVLTLDACMEGWVLCLHFLAINTQSYRTKTMVNVSSEAMSQMLPYHVRGTGIKTQLSLCFVDIGAIFFLFLGKMVQKINFS